MKSASERFLEKVSKSDTCWLFTPHGKSRYSRFWLDGAFILAHRASWIMAHGPIPTGMSVLHRCDVPRCVKPDHLFLGTQSENMRDMKEKGRAPDLRGEKNPSAKLTEQMVREMRLLYPQIGTPKLAKKYGIRQSRVWLIVTGKAWAHVC